MGKYFKILVFVLISLFLISSTAFQFGDIRKPEVKKTSTVMKSTPPLLMYDIRGKWTVKWKWNEPESFDPTFTITFKGKMKSGTFEGISKTHGHEWNGEYKVTGTNITFQDEGSSDPGGIIFPTICTGKIKNKNSMAGTFKNGPDAGTWTAWRNLIAKPKIPILKKKVILKKPPVRKKQ